MIPRMVRALPTGVDSSISEAAFKSMLTALPEPASQAELDEAWEKALQFDDSKPSSSLVRTRVINRTSQQQTKHLKFIEFSEGNKRVVFKIDCRLLEISPVATFFFYNLYHLVLDATG